MKVLFLSTLDPRTNPNLWSGTALSILQGFEFLGHTVQVQTIGHTSAYWYEAIKWRTYRWFAHQGYSIEQDPVDLWFNRRRMKKLLKGIDFDMVASWHPWHLSLVETDKPKIFWYDTTFVKTQPLYFADLCKSSLRHWLAMDKKMACESAAAIYPSEWARQSAINDYGADPQHVHAIPFGANFTGPTAQQVSDAVERRLSRLDRVVRLLFVGVDWERKGGQTAVDVTKELNRRGIPARLIVVGCRPDLPAEDSAFVEIVGRLNKTIPAELQQLRQLYLNSDFFIMTSRAESYGIVYCEAMSNGLPSLATQTGGVGYIVRQNVTGAIAEWGPDTVTDLANFVVRHWTDPAAYRALAESTHQTFLGEFNWEASWRRLGLVIDRIRGSA